LQIDAPILTRVNENHESHIEQAEAREVVFFQQALVNVLFLELLDLRRGHLAAIRGEVAIGLRADGHDLFVR
jgi:hypothetical protein